MSSISIKKIKEQEGGAAFLYDLKLCREVMVYVPQTGAYMQVGKTDIKRIAETRPIQYEVTDKIFVSKRRSMVIL